MGLFLSMVGVQESYIARITNKEDAKVVWVDIVCKKGNARMIEEIV